MSTLKVLEAIRPNLNLSVNVKVLLKQGIKN
jgi:hypothetical protein